MRVYVIGQGKEDLLKKPVCINLKFPGRDLTFQIQVFVEKYPDQKYLGYIQP